MQKRKAGQPRKGWKAAAKKKHEKPKDSAPGSFGDYLDDMRAISEARDRTKRPNASSE